MSKLLFLTFWIFAALGAYCLRTSTAARKVVAAAHGAPILRAPVDFSKSFTNEFPFHHTVQPFYGTIYLTLQADPWPKAWTTAEIATEDLQTAKGEMSVTSTNNTIAGQMDLNWFYGNIPRLNSTSAPLQAFFGRLPLGDYRLKISTKAGVPQVAGAKQHLVVRYDYIHEASIASALRNFSIAFFIAASATAFALYRTKCRARMQQQ